MIQIYYEGCLAGLGALNDKQWFTLEQLHIMALDLVKKHFYHYPIYQKELEKFLKENAIK